MTCTSQRAKIHVTEGREETDRYNGTSATLEEYNGHEFVETNTSDNPEFKKLSESNVGWIKQTIPTQSIVKPRQLQEKREKIANIARKALKTPLASKMGSRKSES